MTPSRYCSTPLYSAAHNAQVSKARIGILNEGLDGLWRDHMQSAYQMKTKWGPESPAHKDRIPGTTMVASKRGNRVAAMYMSAARVKNKSSDKPYTNLLLPYSP